MRRSFLLKDCCERCGRRITAVEYGRVSADCLCGVCASGL